MIAVGLMLVVTLMVSGMQAIVRHLGVGPGGAGLDGIEIAFFRNLFGLAVLLPFLFWRGAGRFRSSRVPLHGLRAVVGALAMVLFFMGLATSNLAEVAALSFSSPIFAIVIAVMFLGERVRIRRITAMAVGFAGILVVLRPDTGQMGAGTALVLAAAGLYAVELLTVKALARTERAVTSALYFTLFMTPLTAIPCLFTCQGPGAADWAWLVLMGALGSGAQIGFVEAVRRVDIGIALPLDYMRLVWAAALSWIVFAEIPTLWTWIGGTMIFGSATYIAFREAQLARRRDRAADRVGSL